MIHRTEVFLDSSFAIALSSPTDSHHHAAQRIAAYYQLPGARVVTTRAVMLEIGNALSRTRFRAATAALLAHFESDPNIEVIPLSEELFGEAARLYRDRSDKEWSLTDCVSFIVMWERGIVDALTADRHFRQAGFRPLLGSSTG